MGFQVPQFIEREPKIIGPLTFKQFITFAIAGGICFVIFFSVPRPVFYFLTFLIMGGAAALMLIKKEGQPLYILLEHFLSFTISPKLYLWQKKETAFPIIKTKEIKKEKKEKSPLKISDKGKLNDLFVKIETKGKQ